MLNTLTVSGRTIIPNKWDKILYSCAGTVFRLYLMATITMIKLLKWPNQTLMSLRNMLCLRLVLTLVQPMNSQIILTLKLTQKTTNKSLTNRMDLLLKFINNQALDKSLFQEYEIIMLVKTCDYKRIQMHTQKSIAEIIAS